MVLTQFLFHKHIFCVYHMCFVCPITSYWTREALWCKTHFEPVSHCLSTFQNLMSEWLGWPNGCTRTSWEMAGLSALSLGFRVVCCQLRIALSWQWWWFTPALGDHGHLSSRGRWDAPWEASAAESISALSEVSWKNKVQVVPGGTGLSSSVRCGIGSEHWAGEGCTWLGPSGSRGKLWVELWKTCRECLTSLPLLSLGTLKIAN